MLGLQKFLDQLKDLPEEKPIEPELKTAANKQKDKEIKERQDLESGVVLQAITSPGEGTDHPADGDLVYVHLSILTADDDLLYTTWADEGGSGQPLAFVLGKGWRAPRAWELALPDMTRNMRKRLRVQPSYGYQHPDCSMQPPAGVAADQTLQFDLQLVNWYPAKQVRILGDDSKMFKRVLVDSNKWEVARPPNEVVFSVEVRGLAYDGQQGTGFVLHSSSPDEPCRAQLGEAHNLPAGLEVALGQMSKGEKASFVLPAEQLWDQSSSSSSQQQYKLPIPRPPKQSVQVEACLELLDLVQVRDVTGDGRVMKKRLREGTGEFPVDCPLQDTTLRLHYRLRSLSGGCPGPWLQDTRQQHSNTSISSTGGSSSSQGSSSAQAAGGGSGPPLEVDSGCGELPEGLELVLKLMVPGELASAVCQPQYAYQGRSDAPAGLSPDDPVEFEAELISFEREGYWQNLDWPQRWDLAERLKDKGNQLFKAKKYQYATNKYGHLLRLIDSTRDFEEQDQVDKADGYKAALLSNLVLCAFHMEEYARSIEWCDKALQLDPGSAKIMFRKGKALSMKGDYEEADEHLAAAAEMDPSFADDVEAARAANKQRAKAAASKQKRQFGNFFGKS